MTHTISNTDSVIDSRDIIERIEELEGMDELVEDEREELNALKSLAEQCEGYGDWEHGEALIHANHFTEYVMEMLSDCGDLPREIPWYIVIDGDATARNIKQDYMSVDFDGEEYLIRS